MSTKVNELKATLFDIDQQIKMLQNKYQQVGRELELEMVKISNKKEEIQEPKKKKK